MRVNKNTDANTQGMILGEKIRTQRADSAFLIATLGLYIYMFK